MQCLVAFTALKANKSDNTNHTITTNHCGLGGRTNADYTLFTFYCLNTLDY